MIISLAMITLLGLIANALLTRIKLPGLLGMLLIGMALGPSGLNLLSPDLLRISDDLRMLALIIILIRAGLGIHKDDLKQVGATAFKLSFIPGLLEGFTVAFLAAWALGFTFIEGGMLGFILAAVTPAVIVPHMLKLSAKKLGTGQGIPTLIMAGASIDDVFAITLFSAFLGLYLGSSRSLLVQILGIPLSILLGVGLGLVFGFILVWLFGRFNLGGAQKVLIVLGTGILMTAIESWLSDWVSIAGLLGVMTMGFILMERMPKVSARLGESFNQVWVLAEIILFVLVGAQVNLMVAWGAGWLGLLIVMIGLVARSLGVLLATWGTPLSWNERLFCVIAYLPKATVQAAIGAIPLSLGIPSGETILALAVISILITAPLGAIGIEKSAHLLLVPEE